MIAYVIRASNGAEVIDDRLQAKEFIESLDYLEEREMRRKRREKNKNANFLHKILRRRRKSWVESYGTKI